MRGFSQFFDRNFTPLFLVQWLGALSDNLLKTALTFLLTTQVSQQKPISFFGLEPSLALLITAGALVLPFVLFSGLAGGLTDKYDKQIVVRSTRDFEIFLALLAFAGLYYQSGELLMVAILGYGGQSAFFGPAKYAALPQLLPHSRLVSANAFFEASTFVAILCGVILGGLLGKPETSLFVGILLLALAMMGAIFARFIPALPPTEAGRQSRIGLWRSTKSSVATVVNQPRIFRATIGIAYFWAVGLVVITTFPEVAKRHLGITQEATTLMLVAFVVGIALGSAIIARLLKGEVSAKFTPIGALLLAAALYGLCWSIQAYDLTVSGDQKIGPAQLLTSLDGWLILGAMGMTAFAGGLYTVPLFALIQNEAKAEACAQAIAGGNIITGLVMVGTVLITSLLTLVGLNIVDQLYLFSATSVIAAIYAILLMPTEMLQMLGAWLLKLFFRVEVKGIENAGKGDEPMVIIANHVSFLDAALIGCFLPGRACYAIDYTWGRLWWMKPLHYFFDLIEIDPTSPFSVRTMINFAKEGRRIVIFPEGRITTTGGLMRVFPGSSMIAAKAGLPVLPVRIDGAERSKFSRLKGKLRLKWFPKITLTVLPPRSLSIPENLYGKKARQWGEHILEKTLQDAMFTTEKLADNLFSSLLAAKARYGNQVIFEDLENRLTYRKLIIAAFALGERIQRFAGQGERIGLMLPTAAGSVASIYACLAFGRKPAMINFTAGPENVCAAMKLSGIQVVLTSRLFVEKAALDGLVGAMKKDVEVIYLDDVRKEIGIFQRIKAFLKSLSARESFERAAGPVNPDDEAIVLFTSGSEGKPKGVSLSHRNFQTNIAQLKAILDLRPTDKFFSVLPVFHSFGLLAGLLLPMSLGIRTFLYPSPLHYRVIPSLVYGWNATVLFGTDTFLAGYAAQAHPFDFQSLRLVAAGAEKFKDHTRALYANKFGIRVYEGYGVTEASPVISLNTPINSKLGSVGRALPGIETRLETVPGIEEGGRLFIRGPNVMRGYIDPEDPDKLLPLECFPQAGEKDSDPAGGWYDTGDILTQDAYGFLTIRGRAKRFAKIGGEMVSLAFVENLASQFWPDFDHVACALPHPSKGEQLVILTTNPEAEVRDFKRFAKEAGAPEISTPRLIFAMDDLPLLGSGKVDFTAATHLAKTKIG